MAHDVFISHSSIDKPVADAAVAVLERYQLRCWVAPRDIHPGADWGASIIDAIHNSRAMVVIFSTHSNASEQVKREVERAVNRGIPLIPLRIADIKPSGAMEFFLSTPHWLDALTPPLEQHLERMAVALHRLLSQAHPPPPEPAPIPGYRKWILPALLALPLLLWGLSYPVRQLIATVDPKIQGSWRSQGGELVYGGLTRHLLDVGGDETFRMKTTYTVEGSLAANAPELGMQERDGRQYCKIDEQGRLVTSSNFLANRLGNVSLIMPTAKANVPGTGPEEYLIRWKSDNQKPGSCAATWRAARTWGGIHWTLKMVVEPAGGFTIEGITSMAGAMQAKNNVFHIAVNETKRAADGTYQFQGDKLVTIGFFNVIPGEWFREKTTSRGLWPFPKP